MFLIYYRKIDDWYHEMLMNVNVYCVMYNVCVEAAKEIRGYHFIVQSNFNLQVLSNIFFILFYKISHLTLDNTSFFYLQNAKGDTCDLIRPCSRSLTVMTAHWQFAGPSWRRARDVLLFVLEVKVRFFYFIYFKQGFIFVYNALTAYKDIT